MPDDNKSEYLYLKVSPNAGRSVIAGFTDGVLHVKVAAPAIKGKANRELVDLFSKVLGIKKSAILLVKGQTSRNKVISIYGLSLEEIIKRLPL